MFSATHSVLVIFLILGKRDSVNQTEGPVTLSEGALLTLNCTYQTTYSDSYHFWYVHHLNKAPQLLLKDSMTNQRPEHEGFQATLVNSDSSFHLQKQAVQLEDSAVYFCNMQRRNAKNKITHQFY
uniref:Ig-like domain-containing protein n=1 Tax=Bos indicus x Bos taurus TaxID=30522 RepID=A0A4W2D0B2_BOBOX